MHQRCRLLFQSEPIKKDREAITRFFYWATERQLSRNSKRHLLRSRRSHFNSPTVNLPTRLLYILIAFVSRRFGEQFGTCGSAFLFPFLALSSAFAWQMAWLWLFFSTIFFLTPMPRCVSREKDEMSLSWFEPTSVELPRPLLQVLLYHFYNFFFSKVAESIKEIFEIKYLFYKPKIRT